MAEAALFFLGRHEGKVRLVPLLFFEETLSFSSCEERPLVAVCSDADLGRLGSDGALVNELRGMVSDREDRRCILISDIESSISRSDNVDIIDGAASSVIP